MPLFLALVALGGIGFAAYSVVNQKSAAPPNPATPPKPATPKMMMPGEFWQFFGLFPLRSVPAESRRAVADAITGAIAAQGGRVIDGLWLDVPQMNPSFQGIVIGVTFDKPMPVWSTPTMLRIEGVPQIADSVTITLIQQAPANAPQMSHPAFP